MVKEILEESWAYQEILEEGREQGLQALRQTLFMFMEVYFPSLVPVAKQQMAGITDPMVLQSVIARMFVIQTPQEAEQFLLTFGRDANKN